MPYVFDLRFTLVNILRSRTSRTWSLVQKTTLTKSKADKVDQFRPKIHTQPNDEEVVGLLVYLFQASHSHPHNLNTLHAMNVVSAMSIQPRRAARRGSCLGRIEHSSPLPPPLRPTNTKTFVSSPSFDSAPTRPRRRTSPVPARPASPVEIDKNDYGYGDDEPDKSNYGYGDMEPESRNSPLSTRVIRSMELPNAPKEKAQRRGSAFGRLQILPDDDTSELERFGIYEDKPDEDEDVRFTNKIARIAPIDPKRARARRRGSALGRLQEDSTFSTLSSSFKAELDKAVYGYEDAEAGAKSAYGYEDADANREMTSTPSPKEVKSRRLQEDSTTTLSAKSGSEEVDKSDYGYEDAETGTQEVDKADYGYEYEDADAGSREVDKVNYEYGYEDTDTGSQDMIDKVDYGYEDADTNRNLTNTHSSREIKARRRGSALGRLQEDSTLSSAKMAIPDASPYPQASQRRMSVGEINSKWSSPNVATPNAAPPRQPSRDRTSIGASSTPLGRLQDFAERYAEQSLMNQGNTAPAPIRRGTRRRSSVGAIAASLGNPEEYTRPSLRTTTPTQIQSRRRMSVGASDVSLGNPKECTQPSLRMTTPAQIKSRRRMSIGASDAPLDSPQDDTRRNSRTQVSITRAQSRRMSVGAACLPAKVIPVEPNMSAGSQQNESKERDSCDGMIRQRAPGRVNRRGSACGRLQSGWDGQAPDMAALDKILLAQGKMGLVNPSKAPLNSFKSMRRVNEYSIPW
jgi:hypothetical protein